MKKFVVILVVLIAFYNSLIGQWVDKSDHQVLSEKVTNLRDFKIFPENNLMIAVDKSNYINKWELNSGKLIESQKVKSDTNNYAFISSDANYSIILNFIVENDSNNIQIDIFSNDDLTQKFQLKYAFKPQYSNNIRIHNINYADFNIKTGQLILIVNYYRITVTNNDYADFSGSKTIQANVFTNKYQFDKTYNINKNPEYFNKVHRFKYYVENYSIGWGDFSRENSRKSNPGSGFYLINNSLDSIFDFEIATKYYPLRQVVNAFDFSKICLLKNGSSYMHIFDPKTASINDSIYGNLFKDNPILLSNSDKFIHQVKGSEYSIYLFENLEKLFTFNLPSIASFSLPIIDEKSGTVIIPTKDSSVVKLKPKILDNKSDILVYPIQDSVLVRDYAVFVVQDTLKEVEYNWDFGDGIRRTTTEKKYRYYCNSPGYLSFKLSVSRNDQTIRTIQIDSIVLVLEKLKADFEFEFLNDSLPRKVMFVNKTKGKYKQTLWFFDLDWYYNYQIGDTVYYNYQYPGNYSLKLIVSNDIDSDTLIKYEGVNIDVGEVSVLKTSLTKSFIVSNKTLLNVYKNNDGYALISGRISFDYDNNYGFYDITQYIYIDKYSFDFSPISNSNISNAYYTSSSLPTKIGDDTFLWFDNKKIAIRIFGWYARGIVFFDISSNQKSNLLKMNESIPPMKSINDNLFISYRKAFDTLGNVKWEVKPKMKKINLLKMDSGSENIYYCYKDSSNIVEFQVYNLSGELLNTYQTTLDKSSSITKFKKLKSNYVLIAGNNIVNNNQLFNFYLKKINLNDLSEKTFSYYNSNDIVDIIEFSNKQIGVFTNSVGRKGFLLLDSNLNLIKDYRIDNLTANIVSVILSGEKLYIFSQKEVNLLTGSAQDSKYYETQINEVALPHEILSSSKYELIKKDDKIIIYPNPATDYITINLGSIGACSNGNNIWASTNASIEIYDVMGILIQITPVETKHFSSRQQRLDVSNLSPGVYFVKIGAKVEKFVKY